MLFSDAITPPLTNISEAITPPLNDISEAITPPLNDISEVITPPLTDMKEMRPTLCRRTLYNPHLVPEQNEVFIRSPSDEKGFSSFFPKPSTSVAQDTSVVLESTKQKSCADQGNNFYSYAETVSGSVCGGAGSFWVNTINEDWAMYSIWSDEVDMLVEGLQGRRMPLEQETFVDGVRTLVKKMFSSFPVQYFCDVMVKQSTVTKVTK